MQEDLAIGIRFKLEAVFLLQGLVVVYLSVGNYGNFSSSEWLVSSFRSVANSESLKAENEIV